MGIAAIFQLAVPATERRFWHMMAIRFLFLGQIMMFLRRVLDYRRAAAGCTPIPNNWKYGPTSRRPHKLETMGSSFQGMGCSSSKVYNGRTGRQDQQQTLTIEASFNHHLSYLHHLKWILSKPSLRLLILLPPPWRLNQLQQTPVSSLKLATATASSHDGTCAYSDTLVIIIQLMSSFIQTGYR